MRGREDQKYMIDGTPLTDFLELLVSLWKSSWIPLRLWVLWALSACDVSILRISPWRDVRNVGSPVAYGPGNLPTMVDIFVDFCPMFDNTIFGEQVYFNSVSYTLV